MGIDDRTKPTVIKIVNVSTGIGKDFTIWKGLDRATYFYGVGPAIDTTIFAKAENQDPIKPLVDSPAYHWYAEMIDAIFYKNKHYTYRLKSYDSYNKEYLYKVEYIEYPGASWWRELQDKPVGLIDVASYGVKR